MDTESSSLFKTISISFALSVAFGLIIGHAKAQLNANDMSRLTNESKQGSTEQVFVSAKKQTQLIELYSSQGCSSCPPAERWVNELSNNEGLWLNFIPMVFHVDYWNYIGWADPYASSENSQRQRQFRDIGAINSVYTPGFVVDGKEWRGWFAKQPLPATNNNIDSDTLTAILNKNKLAVSFEGDIDFEQSLVYVNIAVLGLNITTQVKRGENAGRTLNESFIVLANERAIFDEQAIYDLPQTDISAENQALVVWLTEQDKLTPIQAVGGPIVNF